MNYEISIAIDASREHIWSVLSDVERWPEWTPSMRRVQYISGNNLSLGSRMRIEQPKMPALVWEVIEVVPQQTFSWRTTSAGVTTLATHQLGLGPADAVTVSLVVRQHGPLAWLIGLLTAQMTRRYVQMEANGLKQRCQEPTDRS